MKARPFVYTFLLSVFAASTAHAVLFYESFDYTPGDTLESTTSWAPLNTGTAPTIVSGNLSYTGAPDSTGNMVSFPGGNFQEAIGAIDTSYTTGTVYFSFIFQLSSLPTTASYSFALATGNTNYAAPVFLQASGAGFQIGLSNRSTGSTINYDSTVYSLNTSIFIAGSYTFNAGAGNDTSSLWINPSAATFADYGNIPAPTLTASGGTDIAGISQFLIRGQAGSPGGLVDELRVTQNWTTVVVPEPSAALLGAIGLLGLLRRRR